MLEQFSDTFLMVLSRPAAPVEQRLQGGDQVGCQHTPGYVGPDPGGGPGAMGVVFVEAQQGQLRPRRGGFEARCAAVQFLEAIPWASKDSTAEMSPLGNVPLDT